MELYDFYVAGIPRPQPRPRLSRYGGAYNPPTAKVWKAAVKAAFPKKKGAPYTGAVALKVVFFMPRPRRVKTGEKVFRTGKPDIDNPLKSTMDALTETGAWEDDCRVCRIVSEKTYADGNAGARIIISI
jgi:Holliday junction resolvase RusA-like endonuclease